MNSSVGGKGRTFSGVVVSDRMDKTITVLVKRRYKHPLYGKYITSSKKYHVHDENQEAKVGSVVSFRECRPLSRSKSWRLLSIDKVAEL